MEELNGALLLREHDTFCSYWEYSNKSTLVQSVYPKKTKDYTVLKWRASLSSTNLRGSCPLGKLKNIKISKR
eukprot:snap_masked-scaffold_53-processed-gene-1.68-mRNA-1 protein AED:0.96 eAED:1.00 QI:0/0/0/0.5/1/1/2/0/71